MSSRSAIAFDSCGCTSAISESVKPTDKIDVVHGEVDDHAHIGHARRERSDPGNGDGENVLVADRVFDSLDRRVEPLDMADHQGDAGVPCRGDDGATFFHRGRDRFLDQHMHALLDAAER